MANYKAMYHKIFNTVTDAERLISQAANMMRTAQQECEVLYLEADDTPIALVDKPKE